MISVVVPTHDDRFVAQALESVHSQGFEDYEVVLVPNGKVSKENLPIHPKARVVPYDGPPKVGAVKRFAFSQARGDILLELDHDDLLLPGALEKTQAAFKAGADFVYSDCGEFREDGTDTVPYDATYGWSYRKALIQSRNVTVYESWEPSPATLSLIHYAPNHLRAWSRASYMEAGGHDARLSICDDHDLLIRTYLTGKMVRIPECLYLYRIHGKNTWLERNAEIQAKTWELYSANIEPLILRWARLSSLPCVQLNSAYDLTPGWDPVPPADLDRKWPFEDGSVGAFKAIDVLHVLQDKRHVMGEIHRCLAPGGWLLSATPAAPSKGAFMDPNARSYWNQNTLWYWTQKNFSRWIGDPPARFRAHRMVEDYPSKWHLENDVKYLTFDAVALKEGYEGPGPRLF